MKEKIITGLETGLFTAYLSLISATGKLLIENSEAITNSTFVGYWHGDSCCMQLVLKKLSSWDKKMKVIVTADHRGNSIEKIINRYGARAIRLPDGLKMRPFFKSLVEESKTESELLAAALDGPLGPLHEPKKLLFLLAHEAEREMVYIHFEYARVLRLKNRWDHYVIPLPFSKITAKVESIGSIKQEDLQDFVIFKKTLIY